MLIRFLLLLALMAAGILLGARAFAQAPAPSQAPAPGPAQPQPQIPAPAQNPAPSQAPAPAVLPDVEVPNFWDPRARLERPSPGEIGPIRLLVVDDFPPFSFRDRRGMLIGFDLDLAEAVCKVLKAQCAIQARPFDSLKAALRDGTGNAIMAGLDPEKAAAEGFIATQPYLKIPGRFVARKEGGFDPDAAAPAGPVGVACGTAHQAFLTRFFPKLTVTCQPTPAAGLAELKGGKLAAFFGDALGLSFWLHGPNSEDCCRFAGGAYLDDRYFGAGLSIVMKADDRALKSALDYALREVHRSGAYEEIYLRYFPVGLF